MPKKKLFISHAEKDNELAAAIVELLVNATSLTNSDIINSSLEERGVPTGEDFADYIDSQIEGTGATILLLTPSYFTSRFCLCEMGAVWALTRNVIPLLVPPLRYKDVKAFFAHTQMIKIENTDDLNELINQLQQNLSLSDLNLPRWAMQKKTFLGSLPTILK